MDNNAQSNPGKDGFPTANMSRRGRVGNARRGGLAFIERIFLVILIFTLIPGSSIVSSPTTVSAQQPYTITFLPFISKPTATPSSNSGSWPMVAGNPERTSYTSTELSGSLKAEWFTHFDAYISQKVQIIAADNKLFISASDGLHALDSNSGSQLWFFPTDLPPGNSPTYDNGVLYLGSFNHKLYAIDALSGHEIWNFTAESGFETNPVIANGLVMAGNRDGYFYAVYMSGSQAGQLAWRYKTGGMILYSAAYKDGVVYFASQDMYAYALNTDNGGLIWKSSKLPGGGFHSWWPVIYNSYVVFSGSWPYRIPGPFDNAHHFNLDREVFPSTAEGATIGPYGTVAGDWAPGTRTMDVTRTSQYLEAKPWRRTTIILSRANGSEYTYDSDRDGKAEYAPFLFYGTHSGNRYPPVIGPDNVLYQTNKYVYSWIERGHVSGWKFGTNIISVPTNQTNASDEPLAYVIGGHTVYWKHTADSTAGYFKLDNSTSGVLFDEGGMKLRRTLPELFAKGWDFSYWKHGDTSPPIPYNGRLYTINNNAVVAFSNQGMDFKLGDENLGSDTGTAPSNIERGTVVTGLNTKVTFNGTSWPLLYQQERYYEYGIDSNTRANHFKMLEVAAGSGNPSNTARGTSNSVSSSIVSNFSGGALTTWVSNRAPAIFFQNTGTQYQLRGSLVGIAYPTSSGVQIRTGSATISGSSLSESWMLVWDATTLHRWMPMVISLQNRPSQISFASTGITLSYSGAAGNLGVTPLYGMSAPKSAEENAWRTAVPAATVERARSLNYLAHAFPSSGTEAMNINASGDAELTYTYQYTTTTDAWNTGNIPLAYLPTHLALAAWNGSPIRINGGTFEAITDLGFLTPIGRVAGVANTNTVRVTLPGIANTWRNTPAAPSAPASGDPLQARLIVEVQKILAAGHLAPSYGISGIWDIMAQDYIGHNMADYWHNPAETVYTLIRALPLLPPDLQTQVRAYLNREFAAYPTYSVTNVGWSSGALRNANLLPPEVEAARSTRGPCGVCNQWGFSPENHYASWMYAANFGNAATIFSNTESKVATSPVYPQSLSFALNSQLSGYIGYLRLASLANAGAKPAAEKTMVDMLVLRAALSKYPSALQSTGFEYAGYKWAMRTYAPNMPDTLFVVRTIGMLWNQVPLYGFPLATMYGMTGGVSGGSYEFGVDYVNLVPEIGSFMRSYTINEERAAIADYEHRTPFWFAADIEEGAGEGVVHPLYDTIALYQAKAYILQAKRPELEKYLDAPAVPVGDLYYIQKLIIALEAAR